MLCVKWVLLAILSLYRTILSPLIHFFTCHFGVGFQCKFPVTCSNYAQDQIKNSGNLLTAMKNIFLRLVSCHPFSMQAKKR